ncbi:MAG: tetratricopeptide repeat protein [Methyloligellaceae bacterium]
MGMRAGATSLSWRRLAWKLMASTAIVGMLTACANSKSPKQKYAVRSVNSDFGKKQQTKLAEPKNPLHRATTYWAKAHQKNPKDPRAALNYARNLKALGSKNKALMVLSQAHRLNPSNREIAGEYGRMVLAQGNIKLAQRLLDKAAAGGGKADWKVLSAQGTILAKLGQHEKAQSLYVAALQQQPNASSVLNNLALSYAVSGKADDAEELLRRAVKNGRETSRMRQNLALVLGVQGKFDEAKKLAEVDLPQDQAQKNDIYLRDMVKTSTAVAQAKPPAPPRVAKSAGAPKTLAPPAPAKLAKAGKPKKPTATPTKARATRAAGVKPRRKLAKAAVSTADASGGWAASVTKESSHTKKPRR